ncbi:MAG: thymidine kinase [Clostridiales bacterium]|nr:thymidine kinase [Clostridiales bacterium]
MPKLYFKYGTMASSKSAQALMCKFNYEQKGMKVLLVKPALDTRDDEEERMVRSRIGLKAKCYTISPSDSFIDLFEKASKDVVYDCIIVDEAQFCTTEQINQLKQLTKRVTVLCYGLLLDFRCQLFEGSKRLVELADSLQEIKSVCRCGRKSSVNARFVDGKCVDDGPVVLIGGDEAYESMCYWCWQEELAKARAKKK